MSLILASNHVVQTKLFLSGQVDVDMGPQMYSVGCGDKASMF